MMLSLNVAKNNGVKIDDFMDTGIGGLRRRLDTNSFEKDRKAFDRLIKSIKAYGDSLSNPDLGLVSTFQKDLAKSLKHNKEKLRSLTLT